MKIETPQLSGKPRKVNCWDVESFALCWFLLLFMLVRANNLFWCLFWVSHLIASHAPICSNTSHWKRIKLRLIFPERLLLLFFLAFHSPQIKRRMNSNWSEFNWNCVSFILFGFDKSVTWSAMLRFGKFEMPTGPHIIMSSLTNISRFFYHLLSDLLWLMAKTFSRPIRFRRRRSKFNTKQNWCRF